MSGGGGGDMLTVLLFNEREEINSWCYVGLGGAEFVGDVCCERSNLAKYSRKEDTHLEKLPKWRSYCSCKAADYTMSPPCIRSAKGSKCGPCVIHIHIVGLIGTRTSYLCEFSPKKRFDFGDPLVHRTTSTSHSIRSHLLLWGSASTQPTVFDMALKYASGFLANHAYLPEQEDNIIHKNEADVVHSAIHYLIHPVAQALWACPDCFKAFGSHSEGSILRTRTDLSFFETDQSLTAQGLLIRANDFAVVEFKRRGWTKGEEFSHNDRLCVPAAQPQNRHQFFQDALSPFASNVPNTQANP